MVTGAGSSVPVKGHISVRLSCSGSLLKFQCQDPTWLTNKGRLCVRGQGGQQAREPVKWQEMAWRPVTPLWEQTQHYLTFCPRRHAGSLFWASVYTETPATVRTQQSADPTTFLSICQTVCTHLYIWDMSVCAGTVHVSVFVNTIFVSFHSH